MKMTESEAIKTLTFEDSVYVQDTLNTLNRLRQNNQFCDVILQVGNCEVHAHRAVLACASPYLFDLFTIHSDPNHEFRYKLNGSFEIDAFEKLINFAYTAKLEITENQVKGVYMTANRLKMMSVMKQCSLFLVDMLSPENCIGIRSIPGVSNDTDLVAKVDAFIQKNIRNIVKSKEFVSLPGIQVDVLQKSQVDIASLNERHLCSLVVDWIKTHSDDDAISVDQMIEKMHMLYINSDNVLHDCNDIQTGDANDSEIIQDYKRMSQKLQKPNKNKKKTVVPAPSKPRQLLFSRTLSDEAPVVPEEEETEWRLIACTETNENCIAAIATLKGLLARISVMLRLNSPKDTIEMKQSFGNLDTYQLLPPMSSGRCAVGAADLDGKLLVCGGYDRGECLKTAQLYHPSENIWTVMLPMLHSRGRFDMTVVEDKAYVVGGSDGLSELASVEYYDSANHKWIPAAALPMARSNAGVCSLEDKIYCIGGWNGQVGIKRCDRYDPQTNKWTEISPLILGRYQAGASALKHSVYAVGGCDAWNCMNSVEKYDPEKNTWCFVAPLHTARRGCGVTSYNGKLYVVGGSDGTHSLCSVEIYDPETNTWSPGPNLTSCRANVGVAVVKDRLYAVGGFTGKTFLNTIEVLDPQTNEWTTFTPAMFDTSSQEESSD